eukprot:COSAG02_NODE_21810_length_774_cov_1.285926_1_plen_241_part_01
MVERLAFSSLDMSAADSAEDGHMTYSASDAFGNWQVTSSVGRVSQLVSSPANTPPTLFSARQGRTLAKAAKEGRSAEQHARSGADAGRRGSGRRARRDHGSGTARRGQYLLNAQRAKRQALVRQAASSDEAACKPFKTFRSSAVQTQKASVQHPPPATSAKRQPTKGERWRKRVISPKPHDERPAGSGMSATELAVEFTSFALKASVLHCWHQVASGGDSRRLRSRRMQIGSEARRRREGN